MNYKTMKLSDYETMRLYDNKTNLFVPKIVIFCCNWSVYSAANESIGSSPHFPPNIKFIKIMCGGMVTPAFILKAFELGADGVLIATCHVEDCHYITGAPRAVDVCEKTENLIYMLGIEKSRLQLAWFSAHEHKTFEKAIAEFIEEIKIYGPLPVKKQDIRTSG